MTDASRKAHWENVYTTKNEKEVSWFEESPTISLDLIRSTGAGLDAPLIDIGGGASRLVDALVDNGFAALSAIRDAADRGTPFRLVLLDANMPGMDGFTVASQLERDGNPAAPTADDGCECATPGSVSAPCCNGGCPTRSA